MKPILLSILLALAISCSDDSAKKTPGNDVANVDAGSDITLDINRSDTSSRDVSVDTKKDASEDLEDATNQNDVSEDVQSDTPVVDNSNPDTNGGATVTVSTDTIRNASGDRSVPITIHKPDFVKAVILFFPGFQLEASRYTPFFERLASHGFVVVSGDPDAPLFGVSHTAMASDATAVASWAAGEFGALPMGLMGHSLGAKVMAMAATTIDADAYFGIDPVNGGSPFGGYNAELPDARIVFATFTGDVGIIGETTNGSGGFMPCAPTAENFQTMYDAATTKTIEWDFAGADHMDFVANVSGCQVCGLCQDGTADSGEVQAATATLATAFFQSSLLALDRSVWLDGASTPSNISTRTKN